MVFQLRFAPDTEQLAMYSLVSILAFPGPRKTRRRCPVQCWQVMQQRFVMSDKVTMKDSFCSDKRFRLFRAQKKERHPP